MKRKERALSQQRVYACKVTRSIKSRNGRSNVSCCWTYVWILMTFAMRRMMAQESSPVPIKTPMKGAGGIKKHSPKTNVTQSGKKFHGHGLQGFFFLVPAQTKEPSDQTTSQQQQQTKIIIIITTVGLIEKNDILEGKNNKFCNQSNHGREHKCTIGRTKRTKTTIHHQPDFVVDCFSATSATFVDDGVLGAILNLFPFLSTQTKPKHQTQKRFPSPFFLFLFFLRKRIENLKPQRKQRKTNHKEQNKTKQRKTKGNGTFLTAFFFSFTLSLIKHIKSWDRQGYSRSFQNPVLCGTGEFFPDDRSYSACSSVVW